MCDRPQTNIARAIELSPTFHETVKNIYVMGGSIGYRGNVTGAAEANGMYINVTNN